MDWGVFWTAVGSIVAVIALVGSALALGWRRVKVSARRETDDLRVENEKLRGELERRLRLPEFGLAAIELTERAATLRISELERKYQEALSGNEQGTANAIGEKVREIAALRSELARLVVAKNQIESALRGELAEREPSFTGRSMRVPTGMILVARHLGQYAALQPIDQTSSERGRAIRYVWWYQPDSSGVFISTSAQTGFSEAREGRSGETILELGRIRLTWSFGGDGYGFVYFGPSTNGSPEYELAVLQEIDIARVDGQRVHYQRTAD